MSETPKLPANEVANDPTRVRKLRGLLSDFLGKYGELELLGGIDEDDSFQQITRHAPHEPTMVARSYIHDEDGTVPADVPDAASAWGWIDPESADGGRYMVHFQSPRGTEVGRVSFSTKQGDEEVSYWIDPDGHVWSQNYSMNLATAMPAGADNLSPQLHAGYEEWDEPQHVSDAELDTLIQNVSSALPYTIS